MLIRLDDADGLECRHARWGIRCDKGDLFPVIAISEQKRKRRYLVEYNNRIDWWDADLFTVVDSDIPNEWIEVVHRRHYKIKNPNYSFLIFINYYLGPQRFLDNQDFLFDIYENPTNAYNFYKSDS